MPKQATAARSAVAPSVLTGVGLGAFIDGIVFHQVLQWHHLIVEYQDDDTLRGLETNTLWDGVFHIACWIVVVVGLLWLRARGEEARALGTRQFTGMLLVGIGTFQVVDQIVFHVILRAHHIRMVENYQLYDWSYFALGLVLIAVGRGIARR